MALPDPETTPTHNAPSLLRHSDAISVLRGRFGNTVFARGMLIHREPHAIRRLAVEQEDGEWHVQGDVRGGAPEPYRVDVQMDVSLDAPRFRVLSSVCSCPVEEDCKHGAAVLLRWLSLFGSEQDSDGNNTLTRIAETTETPESSEPSAFSASAANDADRENASDENTGAERTRTAKENLIVRTSPIAAPVAAWLERTLVGRERESGTAAAKKSSQREALIFYVLTDDASLHALRGRRRPDGTEPELTGEYVGTAWVASGRDLPSYARAQDEAILTLMLTQRDFSVGDVALRPVGKSGQQLLQLAHETGRLYALTRVALAKALSKAKSTAVELRVLPPPLIVGTSRAATLTWRVAEREALKPLRLAATVEGNPVALVPTEPPQALDVATNSLYPISVAISATTLQTLASLPAIRAEDTTSWTFVKDAIAAMHDAHLVPPLPITAAETLPTPQAVLSFALVSYQTTTGWGRHSHTEEHVVPTAQLLFDYDGRRRPADRLGLTAAVEAEIRSGRVVGTRLRNVRAEREWLRRMPSSLVPAAQVDYRLAQATLDGSATVASLWALADHDWSERGAQVLAEAQSAGFVLDIDPAFPLSLEDIPAPELSLSPGQENGWYRIALGVTVNGEPVDLAPALARLIGAQKDPEAWLEQLPTVPTVLLSVAHKKSKGGAVVVRIPGERVFNILSPVFDWFRGGTVEPMSALQAAMNPALPAMAVKYLGRDDPRWRAMRDAVAEGAQISPVTPAPGFEAELRPYQLHGLAWLAHLHTLRMGGVLADDMGLGKTVQTLAFLHLRRAAMRGATRQKPSLIVAPTSVTVNWLAEIRRFTPALKVITHYGAERALTDKALVGVDLVLTSYPILQRDEKRLNEIDWDVVVFDEAQMIKNAKSKTYMAAQGVRADMRLALTGTPMENHLGELWALFNLLLPGLLGDLDSFNRIFRYSIEQRAASEQMQKLRQRVRPFLLRRTREDVLSDLPEKTEYTRLIELHAGQADVYESLRTAMDDDIRKVIDRKGLKQSTIHILDALLKLRQVCCDPRLVRLPDSQNRFQDAGSAKLDWLMTHVPELLEEGRQILIFSQFTSMLKLIAESLTAEGIEFVVLTGETTDRETPIMKFQSGEVRVFLLSLKAGGVGLNLTAADTVIHYDPWWNPAVEAQATARAHRIGQVKPVFVTRLVAQGTLEERMMTLLQRKRELAAALLEGEGSALTGITLKDVEHLLAPISTLVSPHAA